DFIKSSAAESVG
ncbi:hypothetical protein EC5905_3120, partial [Escherichia coli 5905]